MVVVQLTTDNREAFREYHKPVPWFGTAPEALLQGFSGIMDIEVHVVSCTQRPMSSPSKLAENIFFHSLHVPKLGWLRTGYQGCIRAVRKRLKKIQPDLVHGQGTERDCAISAVYSGYPNVVTIHGNMAELARLFRSRIGSFHWLTARLENRTLKRSAGVFCNSEYTEGLVRPRARRTWRVANPLRQEFFLGVPDYPTRLKPVLFNVGVICPRKRQLELLDLATRVREQNLEFELQFIGHANSSDPYAAAFLKSIKAIEGEGYARYLGPKSTGDLIRCFDTAGAVIHFPSEEAFGLVVAEALSRNLKFFGSRAGGIVDIASGVPGVELFDLDDWAGLETAVIRWIRSGFPHPMGTREIMAERYHPSVIASRHLEIYQEVLSSAS